MSPRKIGPHLVYPIGLGCMSLSHAYGAPPPVEEAGRLLNTALDLGYTFLDTAALYGFGANETLVGEALGSRRGEYVLASKCGMFRGDDGKREINGRPEVLRRTCEDSLRRLKTELIDLYYLHRWDRRVPIEDSVGELSRLVEEGKIAAVGLSEVSATTLKKAHATHPIAALQTEYSLWTRNAEVAVLEACKEIGAAFVAFSPMGRGFLAGGVVDTDQLAANDIRRQMPRFQGEAFAANLALLKGLGQIARELNATPAQVSLAWLLTRGEHVIPIPGTTQIAHLEANFEAARLALSADVLGRLDELINPRTVRGPRYNAATQAEIDTEELAA
jgi:aryl-alcohol dehydrogenase-like predicted oxidoreductase